MTDKYRFFYRKTGVARYISHLDLMRVLRRMFARADIELTHSAGFNPHPFLSVALPLPVGVDSLCELLDVRAPALPADAVERLNNAAPPGIRVEGVTTEIRPVKELAYASYLWTAQDGDPRGLAELFRAGPVVVPRKPTSGVVDTDIAPHVKQPSAARREGAAVFTALLRVNGPVISPLTLRQALDQAFPGSGWETAHCLRTGLFDDAEKPFYNWTALPDEPANTEIHPPLT